MFHSKLLRAAIIATIAVLVPQTPRAEEPQRRYALSLTGKIKYPPGFAHFDYVNPDAPKGGVVRDDAIGTFDTLNIVSLKGNLAAGLPRVGGGMIYDTLLVQSMDEASTAYGLLAEWVSHPDDYSSVTFKLRDGARWHDGQPITPDDVIFTVNALKKGHPFYAQYYHNVERIEQTGERQVTITFNIKNNRELPFIAGEFPVLPKHYWTGKTADGTPRDLTKTTLEPPLGSGPYRIKEVNPGRSITYERVPDYWGKDLPVRVGQNNLGEVRYEYFFDMNAAFEAFKKGEIDYRAENSAKWWATKYDFPAVKSGKVIRRDDVELKLPRPMQAFVFNMRRPLFADARVRQALNLAFDFEWTNKNIFYGQYRRTSSFFENTEMAAKGLPKGRELEILETMRSEVPAEVFTTEYRNPVNEQPADLRGHLQKAMELLKAAEWTVKDGALRNAAGQPFQFEFLIVQDNFKDLLLPYINGLERLGIKASIRLVDATQYEKRVEEFDFDSVTAVFAQSDSPGNEQRDYWSSKAAETPGSRNVMGIKNPAVDKLIDRIIFAKDRDELVAACRALDRVLLWNHYVVPEWYAPNERFAYWDKFGHPDKFPSRSIGFPAIWWHDAAKAAKLSVNK